MGRGPRAPDLDDDGMTYDIRGPRPRAPVAFEPAPDPRIPGSPTWS